MKFSKTTIIVLFLVIGVAIYVFIATTTDRLIWRTTNAFEELDLPTSFELVNKTKKKVGWDMITSARVSQVRTYRVSMDMASTKETLLGLMRENEEAFFPRNDTRLPMHPEMRGVSALEETCSIGWMALESGTYMTVILGDTEEDVFVELDFDAKVNTHVREVYGAVIYVEEGDYYIVAFDNVVRKFSTYEEVLEATKGNNLRRSLVQEGDYYIVTFANDDVDGKYSTYEEALEVAWENNPNRSFKREFCNTDSDETYVTIVMWAISG